MTDMDSLTELLAKAIHRSRQARGLSGEAPWEYEPSSIHALYRENARTCLTALSEAGWVVVPRVATEKMKDAGAFGPTTMSYGGDTNTFDYISEDDAAHLWSAMVAAGRGETK